MARNDMRPLVSVVIPTYNRAEYLSETIDSVLAQTYPNIEIIVVDDGSTDSTMQVMEKYAGKVNYQRKRNGGVASARNFGRRFVQGEYVALLDSDDICLPQRIALQVAAFDLLPEVVLCSSDFSAFDGTRLLEASHIATYYHAVSETPGGIAAIYPSQQVMDAGNIATNLPEAEAPVRLLSGSVYERLAWGNFIHPPTVMVRRSVLDAVGGFDEDIPLATEYDWIVRVCRAGRAAYLDVPLLLYRYSAEQLSSPAHTEQIALDSLKVLLKIRRDDPELYRRNRFRCQRRMGICYLHAANATLERDKLAAAGQLAKSAVHGVASILSMKVMVKLMLPHAILAWRRRHRPPAFATELHGRKHS